MPRIVLLVAVVLTFCLGLMAAEPASKPTTSAPTAATQDAAGVGGLEKLVGQKVTLTGVYGGPGKFAIGYIKLNASEWVYFKGKMAGVTPNYGQRIQATGILKYDPGFKAPQEEPKLAGLPPHYFFDVAEISAAPDDPASKPTTASAPAKARDDL